MTSATITITGNLAGDPNLKFVPSGQACLTFTLAHTPAKRLPDGSWQDTGDVQWYRCTLWGKGAEAHVDLLRKGETGQVTVTGTLTPSIFDGKNGPQLSLDVRVDTIGVRERRSTGDKVPGFNTDSARRTGNGYAAPAGGAVDDPWATATGTRPTNDEPPF